MTAVTRRDRRAHTLMEVMVVLGLIATVMTPLMSLWVGASRVERNQQARLDLYEAASEVLARVSDDVLASRGLATIQVPGESSGRVGLICRGGKTVHYEIDPERGILLRRVRDLQHPVDIGKSTLSRLPVSVELMNNPGGCVSIRVIAGDTVALGTALVPRGWGSR